MNLKYSDLTARNFGYISSETQQKISQTCLLIAGCGIGSQVAEAAARVGFQNFVLVDADTIDAHNLNRQSFFADQIGMHKAEALAQNIRRINPEARVDVVKELISPKNAKELVFRSHMIFDTIDFLDLKGIVALHDEAHSQGKTLISSFSVGFGAAVLTLPSSRNGHCALRDIFGLPEKGDIGKISYVERYMKLFASIQGGIDPTVLQVMQKVFQDLADGKTCPAPQVAPGANAVAAVCLTAAIQSIAGKEMISGPEMVLVNLLEALQKPGFRLVA